MKKAMAFFLAVIILTVVFASGAFADGMEVKFSTVDLEGNSVDESIFSDSWLTILNFWEYWCNPCKAELPALNAVSAEMGRYGVQVIGVIGSGIADPRENEIEGATKTAAEIGLGYRNLIYTDAMKSIDNIEDGFVLRPTNVFFDFNGEVITITPEIVFNVYHGYVELLADAVSEDELPFEFSMEDQNIADDLLDGMDISEIADSLAEKALNDSNDGEISLGGSDSYYLWYAIAERLR